ncbi:MAG: primosomal protein N', partial [Pseudomonadota bacterium]
MRIARVLFPLPLPEPFDYAIPEGLAVKEGCYVKAPLGKHDRIGVVWTLDDADPDRKLKPLSEVFDVPPMTEAMRQFIVFCARYNVAGPGQVLGMALRSRGGLSPSPTQIVYKQT